VPDAMHPPGFLVEKNPRFVLTTDKRPKSPLGRGVRYFSVLKACAREPGRLYGGLWQITGPC
jgi:hypothetical protein